MFASVCMKERERRKGGKYRIKRNRRKMMPRRIEQGRMIIKDKLSVKFPRKHEAITERNRQTGTDRDAERKREKEKKFSSGLKQYHRYR